MINVLSNSKEFRDVDFKTRKEAAWEARQRTMRHWQFWLSQLALIGCVFGGGVIQQRLFATKDAGFGASCGFFLGLWIYSRVLYKVGMPYYRKILSQYQSDIARKNEQKV